MLAMLDNSGAVRFGVGSAVAAPSLVERIEAEPMTAGEAAHADRAAMMVRKLPKDGAVVIVHSAAAVAPMRALIRALRGATIANLTRVFVAPTLRDENHLLRGLDLPVHRDPFVDEQREHARALVNAWRL